MYRFFFTLFVIKITYLLKIMCEAQKCSKSVVYQWFTDKLRRNHYSINDQRMYRNFLSKNKNFF